MNNLPESKLDELDVELLDGYPRWVCESCMDTGRVSADGSGLSWVLYDPCMADDCPFQNFKPT